MSDRDDLVALVEFVRNSVVALPPLARPCSTADAYADFNAEQAAAGAVALAASIGMLTEDRRVFLAPLLRKAGHSFESARAQFCGGAGE